MSSPRRHALIAVDRPPGKPTLWYRPNGWIERPDQFADQRLDPRGLVEIGMGDQPDVEIGRALGHDPHQLRLGVSAVAGSSATPIPGAVASTRVTDDDVRNTTLPAPAGSPHKAEGIVGMAR
ncbi:hypothetical protein [Mesorhizobium sp. B2-4-19]|uniref:hypothetical protein n=1 Tax=Mesorhizobium sp. B2-4-19 TaxID=2589930 RepID=UPI0015E4364A|nr:hypothetical protein [Mesorhizobium sp. B2-4-19]